MGVKISKCCTYSYDSFSTKLYKSYLLGFSYFKLKKKRLNFIIVANGKMKNCQYLRNG